MAPGAKAAQVEAETSLRPSQSQARRQGQSLGIAMKGCLARNERGQVMRHAIFASILVASALLDGGALFAQSGGSSPSGSQPTQQSGKQNSNWVTAALNQLGACYRNAMERLQEADTKASGEFQKDILKCNQNPDTAKACVDAARKKLNEARLPIDQKRVDVGTTYQNLQSRIQTARANGGMCTSGGCCTNDLGKTAPAVGPDGRTCNMEAAPKGAGNCDNNFQNILNGY